MRFRVQWYDEGLGTWYNMRKTLGVSFVTAVELIGREVVKTHKAHRLLTNGQEPRKLVTIKWGHDKKGPAITFTSLGMVLWRRGKR